MEEFHDIYQKVLKKFPGIKEKEIGIKPVSWNTYLSIGMIDSQEYLSTKKIIRKPTIYVGTLFFLLNQNEKEANMAHEIGHYIHNKKFNDEKLRKIVNRIRLIKKGRSNERINKWSTLTEIYADNQAAKVGYGEPLLSFLKNLYKKDYAYFTEHGKKELSARIENLEEILKNTS